MNVTLPSSLALAPAASDDPGALLETLATVDTDDGAATMHAALPADDRSNDAAIRAFAKTLQVETAALQAVRDVESAGAAFQADGKPTILFERHIFWRRLIAHGIDPNMYAPHYPTLLSPTPGGYGPATEQHARLQQAERIHRPAACESASWGAFQIMGFHWAALRYDSIDAFVDAMCRDAFAHIDALGRFLSLDPRLIRALRARDWQTFARLYNGPNYRINRYDEKLARSYAAFKAIAAMT
jgi:hypothetical protein